MVKVSIDKGATAMAAHAAAIHLPPPPFMYGHCLRAGRLVEVGVAHAFGVPGDFNLTLLDQLLANKGLHMVWYAPTQPFSPI